MWGEESTLLKGERSCRSKFMCRPHAGAILSFFLPVCRLAADGPLSKVSQTFFFWSPAGRGRLWWADRVWGDESTLLKGERASRRRPHAGSCHAMPCWRRRGLCEGSSLSRHLPFGLVEVGARVVVEGGPPPPPGPPSARRAASCSFLCSPSRPPPRDRPTNCHRGRSSWALIAPSHWVQALGQCNHFIAICPFLFVTDNTDHFIHFPRNHHETTSSSSSCSSSFRLAGMPLPRPPCLGSWLVVIPPWGGMHCTALHWARMVPREMFWPGDLGAFPQTLAPARPPWGAPKRVARRAP